MNGMTNAVAVRDPAALSIRPGQTTWDDFQNAALNQLGLEGASNADRAVFLHQCQRTGLDPFAKQIMMIGRQEKVPGTRDQWRTKWTIQTGIEGWRTIRDRAERREGLRGILSRFTYYDHEDNERKVWTRSEPPAVVEVTYTVVEAGGREVPYTSQLRYDEYVQTRKVTQKNGVEVAVPVAQWATKPVHMTEKCTEADVYRKTFPQDYAGIELSDAMPAPDPDAPPIQVQSERVRVTPEQARGRRPQTVTATVVTPDSSPAQAAPPAAAAPPAGAGEDPTTSGASSSAHAPASPSPTTIAAPSPSTSSGSATTPADDPAWKRALGAAQAQLKRFVTGGTADEARESRLALAAQILRTEVNSMADLTIDQLRLISNTCGECRDLAALEQLLATGEATDGE